MEPAIRARGLVKEYGELRAVDGIDFTVPRGICYGFLGPNGAGKTSVMKMIYGAAAITAGSLEVLGHDANREVRAIKARLGVVPQEETLEDDLTVYENLLVYARFFGIPRAEADERIDELLTFAELAGRKPDPARTLSGGMKRRLLICRGLVNRPEALLLDEPTTGLDPQARHHLWERIRELRRSGVTVLLTTHYMEEAEQLCDRLLILDRGRIIEEGEPRALVREHLPSEVVEARLDAEDARERLASSFTDRARVERWNEAVFIYTDDGEEVVGEIADRGVHPDGLILRRTSLEDLFLHRTGRRLR